jgi:hypothetical protein
MDQVVRNHVESADLRNPIAGAVSDRAVFERIVRSVQNDARIRVMRGIGAAAGSVRNINVMGRLLHVDAVKPIIRALAVRKNR